MPAKFCTQCGFEIAEGKRFCGRCGAAVAQKPTTVEAVHPAVQDVSYPATARIPVVPVPVSAPRAEEPATSATPIAVQIESSATLSDRPQSVASRPYEALGPAHHESSSLAQVVPADSRAEIKPRSPRVLIGVGLAALLVIGGALGFYEWHRKSTEVAVVDSPAQVQPATASPSTTANPEPPQTPSAALPAPSSTVATPEPDTKPDVPAPLPPAISEKVRPATPTTDQPRNAASMPPERVAPAPIVRDTPVASKAGVLHYSGPPVHAGEVITFSGLPGAMLRFSFDHASWQPRISHQPDGTQTLTLRSLTQQDQTQCEVRWEVAQ
jgi:hypothetical protein